MNTHTNPPPHQAAHIWGRRDQLIFATFLQSFCCFLALALYSYTQALPTTLTLNDFTATPPLETNSMGQIGGHIAHYLINDLCGINALFLPLWPFALSLKLFLPKTSYSLRKTLGLLIFATLWSSLAIAYWHHTHHHTQTPWYLLPGHTSLQIATFLTTLLGGGVILLLVASLASVAIALITSLPILQTITKTSTKPTETAKPPTHTSHPDETTPHNTEENTTNTPHTPHPLQDTPHAQPAQEAATPS